MYLYYTGTLLYIIRPAPPPDGIDRGIMNYLLYNNLNLFRGPLTRCSDACKGLRPRIAIHLFCRIYKTVLYLIILYAVLTTHESDAACESMRAKTVSFIFQAYRTRTQYLYSIHRI